MNFNDWLVATDDSSWQTPNVDYAAAKAAGLRAVWHRCGYGDDHHPQAHQYQFGKDSTYDRHRSASAAAGVPRGAYFFPIPHASTAAASYDAVMRYTAGERLDLPFMVDMENPPGVNVAAALGQAQLVDWLLDFGQRITATLGRPLAYGGGYLSSYGLPNDHRLGDVYDGQWVANYGTAQDYATLHGPGFRPAWTPAVHPAWGRLTIFQHTGGNGRCPGYPGAVDMDLIDPEWFDRVRGGAAIPSSPPSPPPPPSSPSTIGVPDMLVLKQDPNKPGPETEYLYGEDSGGEWVRILHGPADGIDEFLLASLERRTLGVDKDDPKWPGVGRNGPVLDAMFERARHIGF